VQRIAAVSAILAATLAIQPALAAPPKKKPAAARTTAKPAERDGPPTVVETMAGPVSFTPQELAASRVWNYRAALNVAALQCRYSPFLRTSERWNAIIQQHKRELDQVNAKMESAFRRINGPKDGPRAYDKYNTRLWQNFAVLSSQAGFCNAAANSGWMALATPMGQLATIADAQVAALKGSVVPVQDLLNKLQYAALPPMEGLCYATDRRGRLRDC